MQHGARDTTRLLAILIVVLDIQGCGRAIFFTDRVYPFRIAIGFDVLSFDFGAEGALAEWVVEYRIRSSHEVFFRKRRLL
jgi:hypothetical protein